MKKKRICAMTLILIAASLFSAAYGAAAQSAADIIATSVKQTVDAMISPTPSVSTKELKIEILVNQTMDAYLTGTPTPQPAGNLETAVYGTIQAGNPAPLSAEDAEIATAVHATVQALLPTALRSVSLMRTIEAYRADLSATTSAKKDPAAPAQTPAATSLWIATPVTGSAAYSMADPVACEDAALVSHVSIPDGTKLVPAQPFKKTWRIQNTGSCASPWTTSHQLVYSRGERMGGPWGVHLSKNVSRGETIDISVDMISPSAPGDYTGIWMMADGNGNVFGKQFQVRITVADSGLFACALVSSQQDGPGIVVTLKNTGTEPWSGNDVDLVYSSGEAPTDKTRLDLPANVPVGGTVTFPRIDFNSGRTPGNSVWTLYNNSEAICSFGI